MKQLKKTFLFFLNQYRWRTVLVIGLLIVAGLSEAIGVAAFLPFFQVILESNSADGLKSAGFLGKFIQASGLPLSFPVLSIFITSAITIKAIVLWLALRKVSQTVALVAADLRGKLLSGLLQANWKFFTNHALGKSLNAIVMETFRSSMAFTSMTRFFAYIIQFMVYAFGALLLSWKVFLVGVFIGLLLVVALSRLIETARSAGTQQTETAKHLLEQMADMLLGIKPLRAMALENKFFGVLKNASKGLEKAQFDQLTSAYSIKTFYEPLMVSTALIGLYFAIKYTHPSSSELALMGLLFMRILAGMNSAQSQYQVLAIQESALSSLLKTIEETEAAADDWNGTCVVPEKVEKIVFEDISFAHGENPILNHANMSFEACQMTALIGASGIGKTTILDLISGFYLPSSGKIFINDQPLEEINLKLWRQNLGFVPQEVFLFNDSIFENITMGRKGYSVQDVEDALEAAGGLNFVKNLPEGVFSPVGENGRLLSGGQRQRIAIARAIIHKPQVLLLDEATSALDPQTERVLLETLKKLSSRMALIFVSHNTAILEYAHKIYRLSPGKVEEKTT